MRHHNPATCGISRGFTLPLHLASCRSCCRCSRCCSNCSSRNSGRKTNVFCCIVRTGGANVTSRDHSYQYFQIASNATRSIRREYHFMPSEWAPGRVRKLFENEIRAVGTECASVLRKLGKQLECMQKVDSASLLRGVKCAIDQLQQSLYLHSYLLIHREETRDYKEHREERISVSVIPEVSRRTHDNALEHAQTLSSDDLELAHVRRQFSGCAKKKCISKMHSWPSRREDDLDFAKEPLMEQRVRVLESASALSVGTFATLLMEVALRLDYVVEVVEELGELAGFADSKDKEHADVDIEGRGFHVHAIGAGWQTY